MIRDHVAIFLCAGYGTRMGALARATPKPLLEVAGRPQLDYLLDQVRALDRLAAVHVVSNRRFAPAFEAWAASRGQGVGPSAADSSIPVVVHDDGTVDNDTRLGAIGDLGFVLERIPKPRGALVCAGDNILRFRLAPFWSGFLERGETSVLALHEPDPQRLRRTGVLEIEAECALAGKGGTSDEPPSESRKSRAARVIRLHEKPEDPPSTWACPSFYALDAPSLARVPAYLAEGKPADEIGRLLADLVHRRPVWAHRLHGRRLHVGRPDELARADALLLTEPVILADGEPILDPPTSDGPGSGTGSGTGRKNPS